MKNFRLFVRGVLDGLLDEMSDAVRQAKRSAKKGTSYHVEAWLAQGARGEVVEDSEGNFDIQVSASIPLAPTDVLAPGGGVTPSVGYSSGTEGRFLGEGQLNIGCRVVIVNAVALEHGVDASDPGDTDELP